MAYKKTRYELIALRPRPCAKDGDYNGFYLGDPAIIRVEGGEVTAIRTFAGLISPQGIMKSGIDLLVKVEK